MNPFSIVFFGIIWILAPFWASMTFASTGTGDWLLFNGSSIYDSLNRWFAGSFAAIAWALIVCFLVFIVWSAFDSLHKARKRRKRREK